MFLEYTFPKRKLSLSIFVFQNEKHQFSIRLFSFSIKPKNLQPMHVQLFLKLQNKSYYLCIILLAIPFVYFRKLIVQSPIILVGEAGFEPAMLMQKFLRLPCLPIPSLAHINARFISQPYIKYYSIYFLKSQQKNIYHKAKRRMKKTAIVII